MIPQQQITVTQATSENHVNLLQNESSLIDKVPFNHLIFNPNKTLRAVLQHCHSVYTSVSFLCRFYAKLKAKETDISKAPIKLGQENCCNKVKKTLFVGLDGTLVSIGDDFLDGVAYKTLSTSNTVVKYRPRPYLVQFLTNMSKIYEVVLFSTLSSEVTRAFFDQINLLTNGSLTSFLSEEHCEKHVKGLIIKNLNKVCNRNIGKIVCLDNRVYSFGNCLRNGVPICSFKNSNQDKELKYIQPYLQSLSEADQVREFNRQHLNLEGILQISSVEI